MYINLTFLVQIGNFFIVYLFLKRYFLEPFINIVQQKKQQKMVLQESVYQKQESIKMLLEEKKEGLLAFQEFVIQTYEILPQAPLHVEKLILPSFDKKMLETSIDQVTQLLVKRCTNDVERYTLPS